jgi:hypothetical protein
LRRLLPAIASLLFISLSLCHAAQSVTLAWDASSDPSIAGYKLRYGTTSGNLSQTAPDLGKTTTRTVSNLNDGTTYFFAVTAYNAAGFESPPSNQVSHTTSAPPSGAHVLTVINGSGDGSYTVGTIVPVSATLQAGQQFAMWIGDHDILASRMNSTTTATMPSVDATIEATYTGVTSGDKIRYYPRAAYTDRMVGGIFEGTDGNPLNGTYTTIHTVTTNPPSGWLEVSVSLGNYRYLRYRGPNESYGNVSEIEFYRGGVKVTGVGYGTSGSWNSSGATFDKAFDGNVNTFFDGPNPDGNYTGIDTGSGAATPTAPANQVTALSFSEGSGTAAADNSGSGHSGTLVSGPTWTAGKFDNGLSLDGINDYVSVASPGTLNFGTGDFTISAWINRQATGAEHTILSKTAGDSWTTAGKELFINGNNRLGFGCFGVDEVFSTGTITNDGLWHHVAVTFANNSNTVTLYIDGVASGSDSINLPADVGNQVVKIGSNPPGKYFRGQIDEFRIFNRALSANEVQSIMNNAIE